MTLLSLVDARGVRWTCDARCYDAQTLRCKCICGGKNHARGLEQALVNTRFAGELLIKQFMRLNSIRTGACHITTTAPKQLLLLEPLPTRYGRAAPGETIH